MNLASKVTDRNRRLTSFEITFSLNVYFPERSSPSTFHCGPLADDDCSNFSGASSGVIQVVVADAAYHSRRNFGVEAPCELLAGKEFAHPREPKREESLFGKNKILEAVEG
jgi:hypothetical protein